jgi:tetratricopeptide (TPR) repeat protein
MESTSIAAHEIGRLYYERGDILKAIELLESEVSRLLITEDHETLVETLHLLLRCFAENLNFAKIEFYKGLILKLVEKDGVLLTGKTYYVLALCSSYMNQDNAGLELCQKALSLAIAHDDKETICSALLGIAISYYYMDRLEDSLKEMYNLQVFMNVLDLPQIRISALMLRGQIYRKIGKYEQSLEELWNCYDLLKQSKNLYSSLSLFYGLALTYKDMGQFDEARKYLQLAHKAIDQKNLKKLSNSVETLLASLGDKAEPRFDIVYNGAKHLVMEKNKGRIDFNNQFILLDLLELFLNNPGVAYSKEQLVKIVWKQSYNPEVHDNKIYVTIKRLRQLIEPDMEKPKYIFRSKNGYYFSKESRVQLMAEKRESV